MQDIINTLDRMNPFLLIGIIAVITILVHLIPVSKHPQDDPLEDYYDEL